MKKEELELILGFVAQRTIELTSSQFASVAFKEPRDLLDALGFIEVGLVKPTAEAIVVVECGDSQVVILGNDEALRFVDKRVESVSILNGKGLRCFVRHIHKKPLDFLPLDVVYLMQGKTPEWFAKQYSKHAI